MKLITRITALGGAALLASGMAVIAVAAPASAHTIEASATCEALTVDLSNYAASQPGKDAIYKEWDETVHHPAVGEPTITIPNPDYQPAVAAVPGSWEKYNWTAPHGDPSGPPPAPGWHDVGVTGDSKGSAVDTIVHTGGNGYFYYKTLTAPVAGHPAVGTPTITIPNPNYQAPSDEVVHHKDLIKDAVAPKTNHVVVTIDGSNAADTDFSTTYEKTFPFADKYVAHTWSVDVTAWDNSAYSFHRSGTTVPCEIPVGPANPNVTITATCGAADLDVTNPDGEYQKIKTAAVTVWIDGDFEEAIAVAGDASAHRHYTFSEDSGDHTIVVKNAESEGGAILASSTIHSDCIPNIVKDATAALILTQPTCDKDGTVKVNEMGLANASLVGKLDSTVGDHTATFVADEGHAFASGETTLELDYTVKAKTGNCPITVVVTPPAAPPVLLAVPAPPVQPITPVSDVLASTGSDELGTGIGVGAAALILAGLGGLLVAAGVRRRKVNS